MDLCLTKSRLEIKSHQSTHLNSFRIEHITKTYRINNLISSTTTPRYDLTLSLTFKLHCLRSLKHNYRKHLRFFLSKYLKLLRLDRLKNVYLRLSFPNQQQRNRSQRLNERFEIEVR